MNKMIVFQAWSAAADYDPPLTSYQVRQGLPPHLLDAEVLAVSTFNISYVSYEGNRAVLVSPDQRKMLTLTGFNTSAGSGNYPGNHFYLHLDTDNLASAFSAGFTFSGNVKSGAISNAYVALGGTSSALSIIELATQSVININRVDLGATVTWMEFSPDGQYLYVAHTAAPYLRRYNVSNFMVYESVDAAAVHATAGPAYALKWTPQGILVAHYGSTLANLTGFALYSHDLQNRLSIGGYYRSALTNHLCFDYDPVNDQYILTNIYGLPDIARRICGRSERTQLQQSIRPTLQPVGCGPDEFRAAHASLG